MKLVAGSLEKWWVEMFGKRWLAAGLTDVIWVNRENQDLLWEWWQTPVGYMHAGGTCRAFGSDCDWFGVIRGWRGYAWGMPGSCLFLCWMCKRGAQGVGPLQLSKCGIRTSPRLCTAWRTTALKQVTGCHWSILPPSGVLFPRAFLKVVQLCTAASCSEYDTSTTGPMRSNENREKWHKRKQRWPCSFPHLEKATLSYALRK